MATESLTCGLCGDPVTVEQFQQGGAVYTKERAFHQDCHRTYTAIMRQGESLEATRLGPELMGMGLA